MMENRQAIQRIASSVLYTYLLLIVLHQFRFVELGISCTYHDATQNGRFRTSNVFVRGSFSNRNRDFNPHISVSLPSSNQTRRRRAVYMAIDDSKLNVSRASVGGSSQNDQPTILDQCCACDEAKYELVFDGLWSRYTHPDDFPENFWLAYFSDIIGASHSNEFKMWDNNALATEGVKELAETGSTKKLESELKQVSQKTRTIIKARELRYPNLNGKTSAVFRTDKQHHLVSVLSKLGPSPDWMVGVSSLELCQSDCTWAFQRVVNLHLWDAGTDSGVSFTSPDSPTRPQERIKPFRKIHHGQTKSTIQRAPNSDTKFDSSLSSYQKDLSELTHQQASVDHSPEIADYIDANSPKASADQLKPFARLTITRQRIYEKSCSSESSSVSIPTLYPSRANADTWFEPTRSTSIGCRFTDWSDWSRAARFVAKAYEQELEASWTIKHPRTNACKLI